MRFLKTTLTVIGAVTVLVLAGNTIALATTGQALLLGKSNSANAVTSISRTTSGSALKLQTTSSTAAPLTVNGKGKVTNLNADTLDGIDSTKFGTRVLKWVYTGSLGTNKTFTLTGIPNGTYLMSFETFANPGQIADGNQADCYFAAIPQTGSNRYSGEAVATKSSYGTPLSGTGLVTKNTGDSIRLYCRTTDVASTWSAATGQPVRISAVPVRSVTNMGTPSAARVSAKR